MMETLTQEEERASRAPLSPPSPSKPKLENLQSNKNTAKSKPLIPLFLIINWIIECTITNGKATRRKSTETPHKQGEMQKRQRRENTEESDQIGSTKAIPNTYIQWIYRSKERATLVDPLPKEERRTLVLRFIFCLRGVGGDKPWRKKRTTPKKNLEPPLKVNEAVCFYIWGKSLHWFLEEEGWHDAIHLRCPLPFLPLISLAHPTPISISVDKKNISVCGQSNQLGLSSSCFNSKNLNLCVNLFTSCCCTEDVNWVCYLFYFVCIFTMCNTIKSYKDVIRASGSNTPSNQTTQMQPTMLNSQVEPPKQITYPTLYPNTYTNYYVKSWSSLYELLLAGFVYYKTNMLQALRSSKHSLESNRETYLRKHTAINWIKAHPGYPKYLPSYMFFIDIHCIYAELMILWHLYLSDIPLLYYLINTLWTLCICWMLDHPFLLLNHCSVDSKNSKMFNSSKFDANPGNSTLPILSKRSLIYFLSFTPPCTAYELNVLGSLLLYAFPLNYKLTAPPRAFSLYWFVAFQSLKLTLCCVDMVLMNANNSRIHDAKTWHNPHTIYPKNF